MVVIRRTAVSAYYTHFLLSSESILVLDTKSNDEGKEWKHERISPLCAHEREGEGERGGTNHQVEEEGEGEKKKGKEENEGKEEKEKN